MIILSNMMGGHKEHLCLKSPVCHPTCVSLHFSKGFVAYPVSNLTNISPVVAYLQINVRSGGTSAPSHTAYATNALDKAWTSKGG